jgi:hypothetical protein
MGMAETGRPTRRWRSLAPTFALAAGCVAVYAFAASDGDSETRPGVSPDPGDSIDPEQTAPSSPKPTVVVSPPPLPPVDVVYDVIDGVTVSAYLPPATAATPDVWERVGPGWVLAAYEGGLLESGRVVAEGVYWYSEVNDAVRGVRVLYLVSPAGEVYEVANLTEAGVREVLAWDVGRGVALVTNGVSDDSNETFAEIDARALDLESGEFGPWFLVGEEGNSLPAVAPVDGAWLIGTTSLVDDQGAHLETGLAAEGATTADWLDGWLIQSHLYPGGRPVSGTSLYVSEGWDWPVTEVPAPVDPSGNAPMECRASRVASPDVVAFECQGWSGGDVTTVATLGAGETTMTVVVPWDGAASSRTFRRSEVGCIRDGVAYEALDFIPDGGPDLDAPLNEGLWLRSPGAETRMAGPAGQVPPLRCVGALGEELVIVGAGPIWAYGASGAAAWRTLLPVPAVPADSTGPRYVAGVTDLGVFVAP